MNHTATKLLYALMMGMLMLPSVCQAQEIANEEHAIQQDTTLIQNTAMNIYDFTVLDIKKQPVKLDRYKGKVLLVVNTATGCGFTPQYEGLEALYKKYKDQGFVVLDFPCNQFANQAPGTEEEIVSFCQLKYDVSFPQFAKIKVNGDDAEPLYKYLKEQKGGTLGKAIKWNFTKFLIDQDGNVIERYAPTTKPESIEKDIVSLLNK